MRQTLRCGWPTQWTTGPDPFAVLTTYPGPYPFRMRAGQTYQNLVINGCVLVEGDNSVLRNSIVRGNCSYFAINIEEDIFSGVVIERVEVDLTRMNNRWGLRAISGSGFTLDRVRCWGGGDCVHYGGDVVIKDSLFDVPECTAAGCSSLHIDGLHSASGHPDPAKRHVLIQHNTIIMHGTGDGHPNAAIINGPDIGPYAYPQGTVIIRDNLMAGGGAVAYCQAHPEDSATNTAEIWNNRISDLVWPRGGKWGPFYDDCMNPPAPGRLTNVWDRTGQIIPLGSWG